ncbi:hypothetical protein HJC23_003701 [Cyclotella cryptica]|uniref:Uncharacterized protein n=1 Tax=Cyclotella cryptica TaxID=29204 RepID=A0ABD3QTX0_9STRA
MPTTDNNRTTEDIQQTKKMSSSSSAETPQLESGLDYTSAPAETNQLLKSSSSSHDDACPLFMDKLPSNFATNSGLAAIASLLNDDENEADYDNQDAPSTSNNTSSEKNLVAVGGGKAATRRRRDSNRYSPYKKNAKRSESVTVTKSDTTVGEAQLFLSMWKM